MTELDKSLDSPKTKSKTFNPKNKAPRKPSTALNNKPTEPKVEKIKQIDFRPKTFDEVWKFITDNIRANCFYQGTDKFNKELFNKKKAELKPLVKELWNSNTANREKFYKSIAMVNSD